MNFYKLYIGDYQRDTGTLTLAEHGAYALMLQYFYATERPLPAGRELYRLLRADTPAERKSIDSVAARFWRSTDDGLVNDRALEEIRKGSHQRDVNKELGKRGGRPKKTESVSESVPKIETESVSQSVSEPIPIREPNRNPNHSQTPEEIPSEPNGSGSAMPPPPGPAEVIFGFGVPMLVSAGTPEKQARSFLGALRKRTGNDQAVADALQRCATEKPLQPIEWLAAALPAGAQMRAARPSKHTGFSNLNYREGVTADGALA